MIGQVLIAGLVVSMIGFFAYDNLRSTREAAAMIRAKSRIVNERKLILHDLETRPLPEP